MPKFNIEISIEGSGEFEDAFEARRAAETLVPYHSRVVKVRAIEVRVESSMFEMDNWTPAVVPDNTLEDA